MKKTHDCGATSANSRVYVVGFRMETSFLVIKNHKMEQRASWFSCLCHHWMLQHLLDLKQNICINLEG